MVAGPTATGREVFASIPRQQNSVVEQNLPRLRLRGTFIDFQETHVALSPRAHSEPRRLQHHLEFEPERSYVEQLCSREFLTDTKLRLGSEQNSNWQDLRGSGHNEDGPEDKRPHVRGPNADQQAGHMQHRLADENDDLRSDDDAVADWCHDDVDESIDESTATSAFYRLPSGGALGQARRCHGEKPQFAEVSRRRPRSREDRRADPREQNWDSTTNVSDDYQGQAASQLGSSARDQKRSDLFLGRPGPRSEPGGHICPRTFRGVDITGEKRQRTPPLGRRIQAAALDAVPDSSEHCPAESSGGLPRNTEGMAERDPEGGFKSLRGAWRGSLGIWTIQEDGRALFNGGHMGDEYDIEIQKEGDATVIQRGDGWKVDPSQSSSDTLVWTTTLPGEDKMTWKRVNQTKEIYQGSRLDGKSREELRSKMAASAQQFSEAWSSERRRSTAMAAIEEIPIRIGDDMQKVTSRVVDDVQNEVAAMRKQIRGAVVDGVHDARAGGASADSENVVEDWDEATAKVVKHLEAIPTMILNLLEARVGKAKQTVRHRVQGMMQNLSAIQEENWDDNEELASQMKMISDEVEIIAGDAVEAAAQECRAHAARQLDFALSALRGQQVAKLTAETVAGQVAEQGTTLSDPAVNPVVKPAADWSGSWANWGDDKELWPEKAEAGTDDKDGVGNADRPRSYWKSTVAEAVAVVQDKAYVPQSIANQFVADELLRAKASRSSQTPSRADDLETCYGRETLTGEQVATNIGSVGHPDLCQRPCVYFATGNCMVGQDCSFCHLSHPKRPVRLDKRHRDSLKRMSFPELLTLVMPVVRHKLADVLSRHGELRTTLDKLEECTGQTTGTGASAGSMAPTPATLSCLEELGSTAASPSSQKQRLSSRRNRAVSNSDAVSEVSSSAVSSRSRKDNFSGALHVMGLRTLLTMLSRLAPADAEEIQAMLQQVLKLSRDSHLERFAEDTVTRSEAEISLHASEASRAWATQRSVSSAPHHNNQGSQSSVPRRKKP